MADWLAYLIFGAYGVIAVAMVAFIAVWFASLLLWLFDVFDD